MSDISWVVTQVLSIDDTKQIVLEIRIAVHEYVYEWVLSTNVYEWVCFEMLGRALVQK